LIHVLLFRCLSNFMNAAFKEKFKILTFHDKDIQTNNFFLLKPLIF